MRQAIIAGVAALAWAGSANAALTLQVNYAGPAEYASTFASAAATWQNLLQGYQNGLLTVKTQGSSGTVGQVLSTVVIQASVFNIDGVGGVLGQAGPTEIAIDASNFVLATDGEMSFDTDDVATLASTGGLADAVLHEMAHVLGLGTLWTSNGVYANGSGQYTGVNALTAYRTEFSQPGAAFVPVELGGGQGTADGHWNEVDNGAGLTGITDALGRDLRNELMTGWLNSPSFISHMTVMSFRDIGFAVPEPSAMLSVAVIGCVALLGRRGARSHA